MNITVYTINAFAKTNNGGNPAGVVLDADKLTQSQMMTIARIVGFSETAFVMKSECADYKIRFFTPVNEVDLCGHATIGTFSLLKQINSLEEGSYSVETKAGKIKITISKDATVMMSQIKPLFCEIVDKAKIAESLNISVADIVEELDTQVVTTGLRDIIVPIINKKVMDHIKPDFAKISKVSKEYNVVGYHLYTKDTLYNSTAYCRNLAPLVGIPEEAATGTSNGALACYLAKYNQLIEADATKLVFEQGYTMDKPSEIIAALSIKDGKIEEVLVGGAAKGINKLVFEDDKE